jgi:hypothetical protein
VSSAPGKRSYAEENGEADSAKRQSSYASSDCVPGVGHPVIVKQMIAVVPDAGSHEPGTIPVSERSDRVHSSEKQADATGTLAPPCYCHDLAMLSGFAGTPDGQDRGPDCFGGRRRGTNGAKY